MDTGQIFEFSIHSPTHKLSTSHGESETRASIQTAHTLDLLRRTRQIVRRLVLVIRVNSQVDCDFRHWLWGRRPEEALCGTNRGVDVKGERL